MLGRFVKSYFIPVVYVIKRLVFFHHSLYLNFIVLIVYIYLSFFYAHTYMLNI